MLHMKFDFSWSSGSVALPRGVMGLSAVCDCGILIIPTFYFWLLYKVISHWVYQVGIIAFAFNSYQKDFFKVCSILIHSETPLTLSKSVSW